MTFVYLICFLLVTVGILFMLKLTPEKITNDLKQSRLRRYCKW